MRRRWGSVRREGSHVSITYPLGNGTRHTETVYGGMDPVALLDQREREVTTGTWVEPEKITMTHLAIAYLTSNKRWAPSTVMTWTKMARYLVAIFGDQPLQAFTKLTQAEAVAAALDEFELSPKTKSMILETGRAMFGWAIKHDWLDRNPLAAIQGPSVPRPDKTALTPEQARKLYQQCVEGDPQSSHGWHIPAANMIGFALLSCKRFHSEVCALRWQDIDAKMEHYLIAQVWDQAAMRFKQSGNSKGKYKSYPISPQARLFLERQRKQVQQMRMRAMRNGYPWRELDLVFPNQQGEHLSVDVLKVAIQRMCRRAGVPAQLPHELARHTGVSLNISLGATKWDILEMTGLSSMRAIEQTYGHMFADDARVAVNRMGTFLAAKELA